MHSISAVFQIHAGSGNEFVCMYVKKSIVEVRQHQWSGRLFRPYKNNNRTFVRVYQPEIIPKHFSVQ